MLEGQFLQAHVELSDFCGEDMHKHGYVQIYRYIYMWQGPLWSIWVGRGFHVRKAHFPIIVRMLHGFLTTLKDSGGSFGFGSI